MKPVQVVAFVVMACLIFNAVPARSDGPKVLLNLSKFRNWLQLDYRWHYHNSVNKEVKDNDLELKDHLFIESYHSSFEYSIYDPLILNGRFSTDLGLNQEIYHGIREDKGMESGTILGYDIDGTFFERRSYPIHFFSSNKEQEIQRIFARNYDLHEHDHGLDLTLKNDFVPTNFRYFRRRRETDGLELDRVETTETFTVDALHLYKDLSHTEASFYHSDDDVDFGDWQPADKSRIKEYRFRNTLRWGTYPARSRLDSTYRLRDETDTISISFREWSESLLLQPGRALRIGLDFDYNKDSTEDLTRDEHREQIWIEHRLYESFISRLKFLNRNADYTAGMHKQVQGQGGLSYRKELPRSSLFSLGYIYTKGSTERSRGQREIPVYEEEVTMNALGQNSLENLDIIADSIVVHNEDRHITYVEGADYIVLQYGRQTELMLTTGSQINPDDVVSVDYLFIAVPGLHYSTRVHQASSSLSLFSNRYRIYTYLVDSDQRPLSEDTDEDDLYDLFTYCIGLVNTRRFATYGGEFVHYDSTTDKRQYVELSWRYRRYYRRNYLWLSFRDRFIRHQQTEMSKVTDGGTDLENQLYAGASVRRRLFGRNIAKAGLEYLDVRGGYAYDRKELNLNLNFDMHVGRLELRFRADRDWEWWENRRRGETRVFLMVRRYLAF
jgi:hypothetical protein